ncbi:MAG: hypothetical protein WC994_06160 [Brumimicrobium sp.]
MNFFKKLTNFLKSRQFIFNVLLIVVAWIALLFIAQKYFDSYSNYGENIEVPVLLNNNADDIPALIGDRQLLYEILDSVYHPNLVDGTVIYQNPMPTDSTGVGVKANRTIQIRVSKRSRLVKVPIVISKSERFAEVVIMTKGLRTKKTYVPSVEDQGVVIQQLHNGKEIKPNQQLPINSVIELVIGTGKRGEMVAVPNLVGLTINESKERSLSSSLKLVPVCSDCITSSDSLTAKVISQTPIHGDSSFIPAGSVITVFASSKNELLQE